MRALFFAIGSVTLLGLSSYGDTQADPLFSRMEGHWTGTGTVTRLISGTQEALLIDVNSVVSTVDGKERLTSTSQVTETQTGTSPLVYQTAYWITPDAVSGTYDLGYGSSAQPTTTGTFNAQLTFETSQPLGTGPSAYVIHSSTQFQPDGSSDYTEVATHGPSAVSRTTIHYQH